MYKTINFSMFCDEWNQWEDRKDTFTYEAKKALFEYLEDVGSDLNDGSVELDIIALCCDWAEYDDIDDVKASYSNIKNLDDLKEKTIVLVCENGHLLILNF